MGSFPGIPGGKQKKNNEHAVIAYFIYGYEDLQPLFNLSDRLEKAILAAGVGRFDGNEVNMDGDDASLYMYGPDGDNLFRVVKPILESASEISECSVLVQYGPPETGVRRVIHKIDSIPKR
jgi:hypothetical protein